MTKAWLFLPFAAFVALSGYVGWQMGQPLTETDVLNHFAAEWVKTGPEGAALTDCHGLPSANQMVWIVVTCARNDITRTTEVAPNGRSLTILEGPQA